MDVGAALIEDVLYESLGGILGFSRAISLYAVSQSR